MWRVARAQRRVITVTGGYAAATALGMLPAAARAALPAALHTAAMRRASAAATPQHQPPHQQEGASDDAITLASVSSALGVGVDSSGVHSLSSLLRPTAVGELERPGAVVAQPARVPFTAWKPLKPKIQSIIDSRLIALRRKEHPEWLDKQSVRKMTLRERQTLLTKLYQEYDIVQLNQKLSKCGNSNASLQYIDRAHDMFTKVYSHASMNNWHAMMRAASRFRQPLRVDEYFRAMIPFHPPTRQTYLLLLHTHAVLGHTKRVEEVLHHMQHGCAEWLGIEGDKNQAPLLSSSSSPESEAAAESEAAVAKTKEVPSVSSSSSPDFLHLSEDPSQRISAAEKRRARHAATRLPVSEKHLYFLLQSHAANNDTPALLDLVHKLEETGELFPFQATPRLRLTLPIAELLMHYYSLHRLLDESVRLMRWVAREGPSSVAVSARFGWHFFDAFKRQVAWAELQRHANASDDDHPGAASYRAEAQRLLAEEALVRARRDPRVAPTVESTTPPPVPALPPISHKWTAPALRDQLPAALMRAQHAVRSHPFPAAINSSSLPASLAPGAVAYPASPNRVAARTLRPSPLDRAKEDVDVSHALKLMAMGNVDPSSGCGAHDEQSRFAGGFLPGARVVDAYLGYYLDTFFPVRRFPTVMAAQMRSIEAAYEERGALREAFDAAAPVRKQLLESLPVSSRPASRDDEVEALSVPFSATSRTFGLVIHAHLVREPLGSFTPESVALRSKHRGGNSSTARAGPSDVDLAFVHSTRARMRQRGLQPSLQTKIDMMVVMAHQEQWAELYAAFTLLWKADKLRARQQLIEQIRNKEDGAPAASESKEKKSTDAEDANADVEKDKSEEEEQSFVPDKFGSSSRNSEPFTCMSLVPVVVALGQRSSLDRLNLFVAVLTSTRDFPLTMPFFQVLLNILAERGATSDLLALLKLIAGGVKDKTTGKVDARFKMPLRIEQYNALLASVVRRDPKAMLSEPIPDASGNTPALSPRQQRLVTIFQIWELLKLLKIQSNPHTLQLLMTGVLHYGELVDGRRLWGWILMHGARPSISLYTTWVSFLLKHGELGRALHALRSQSLKEGYDWTLKQCYILLNYLKSNLLKHARRDGGAADGAPSSLSAEQAEAVYVPTAEQQALYADITARCSALEVELLKYEKQGGRLGRRGLTAVSHVPGGASGALRAHKEVSDPIARASVVQTPEQRDEDLVASMSFIPASLFQRSMVPLLRLIDQFADNSTPSLERAKDRKQHMQLLLEGALEPTAIGAFTSSSEETAAEGEESEELPAGISLAEQSQLRDAIDALEMDPTPSAAASDTAAAATTGEDTDLISADAAEEEVLASNESQLQQPAAESAEALLESIEHQVAEADPAAAVAAVEQGRSFELANDAEAAAAARALGIAVEGCSGAKRQSKAVKAKKSGPDAASVAGMAAKKARDDAREASVAAARSGPALPPPPPEHAAVVADVSAALDSLAGKAKQARKLLAPLGTPVSHPITLTLAAEEGSEGDAAVVVDLCAARTSGALSKLKVDHLRAVQTQLMHQPQPLVKGLRSHHVTVVEAWLRHCPGCQGVSTPAPPAAQRAEKPQAAADDKPQE